MIIIRHNVKDGMELAKKLRSRKEEVFILFITGVKEYVFDGYSVDAISYLLKPVQKDRLMECLDKAYTKISSTTPYILMEMKGDISKVKTSIYISHRMSNCRFCDNILVFEDGTIVERGSHNNLIAVNNCRMELM